MAEERRVPLGVAMLRVVEVAHRAVGHEQRRHRANTLHAAVRHEPGFEARAATLELLVNGAVVQAAQDRKSRGGCEWIPGQRARLVDVAARREAIHDLRTTAERCERK